MRIERLTALTFLGAGFITSSALLLLMTTRASALRPIADDYCYAAVAQNGLLQGVFHWWSTWSGDLLLYTLKSGLVGIPLANGLSIASAVPFVASGLCLGLALVGIIFSKSLRKSLNRSSTFGVFLGMGLTLLLAPLLWWAGWYTMLGSGESSRARIASFITHWQDVNVGYVLVPSLCVVLAIAIQQLTLSNRAATAALASVLAFAIPLLSLMFGVTLLLLLAVGLPLSILFGRRASRREVKPAFLVSGGLLVGIITVLLAPGTASRLTIQGSRARDIPSLIGALDSAAAQLTPALWNPGFFLGFIIFAAVGALLKMASVELDVSIISGRILGLAAISVTLIPVTVASQILNYPALWHWIQVLVLIYLLTAAVGLTIGYWIPAKLNGQAWVFVTGLILLVALVCVPLVIVALQGMTNSMDSRLKVWVSGSAPTIANADISPGSGWGVCWSKIERSFGDVDRQLFMGYKDDRPPTMPLPF